MLDRKSGVVQNGMFYECVDDVPCRSCRNSEGEVYVLQERAGNKALLQAESDGEYGSCEWWWFESNEIDPLP